MRRYIDITDLQGQGQLHELHWREVFDGAKKEWTLICISKRLDLVLHWEYFNECVGD